MGEPAEALYQLDLCSEIRGRPCHHPWLVCLSKCLRGDHWQGYWSGKSLYRAYTFLFNSCIYGRKEIHEVEK